MQISADTKLTIDVAAGDLDIILKSLAKQPYELVVGLIENLTKQAVDQTTIQIEPVAGS